MITHSDRVRAHAKRYPHLTPAERARKLQLPDEVVRSALRRSARRGRPPKDCATITVVVPRRLLDHARSAAETAGCSLEDWARSTLASEAVPPGAWSAYQDHEKAILSRTSQNRKKRTKSA